MTARRCPRCGTGYQAPARFCVDDGSPLVEVDVAPDAPRSPPPTPNTVPRVSPVLTEAIPDLAALTGTTLDDRYRITHQLGEGGMSYVYQAEDLETDRTVALKILLPRLARDPAVVKRLHREATIATRLNHPNVCPILRLGETSEGLLYLVMPFLQGQPLSEYENQRGPFSLEEGIPLLVEICQGLQHAHELQIVHRDLKPENVMLVPKRSSEGSPLFHRAVVTDFGLAKERRSGAAVAKLTAAGMVLGTPEFMSPEQIHDKPLDGRSDLYALGILAFEMFTTELPFGGQSGQETMLARLRSEPRRLRELRPDLPAKLEAVIARALARDRNKRYGSMHEMAEALDEVRTGLFRRLFRR